MSMRLTRREVVLGGAAGAATAFLGVSAARAVPGPQARFGGFAVGLQSYSLRHLDLDACLEATAGFGLHHVELFGAHLSHEWDAARVADTARRARRLDLRIDSHGVSPFSGDHEANRKLFVMANRAGIRNLSADPVADDETFSSLEKLVDEFGVRIAIHNHGPSHHWGRIEPLSEALEGRHPRLGVCADLGHFIRADVDPIDAIHAFEGRLFGIHLKDFDAPRADAENRIIGEGLLDLEKTFAALREVRFPADGALSLEYEQPDPEADIVKCLEAAARAANA